MQGFEHEITQAMTDAYASACKLLGLNERVDPATDIIAMKIIGFARQGETDPVRLLRSVMTHCGLQELGAKRTGAERNAMPGSRH